MGKNNIFLETDIGIVTPEGEIKLSGKKVSINGIYQFASVKDLPNLKVGTRLELNIHSASNLRVKGIVTSEISNEGSFWNIRFINLESKQKVLLVSMIENQGIEASWERKSPRIPSVDQIKYIPLDGTLFCGELIFPVKIRNISLGGVLLESISDKAEKIELGFSIDVLLRARDDLEPIEAKGTIVRISQDFMDINKDPVFLFGVQFKTFKDSEKEYFMDMIKKVCEEIRDKIK